MSREVITPLPVSPGGSQADVVLPPGTLLTGCRIHRDFNATEVYVVVFETGGQSYACPLYRFQPRTRAVAPLPQPGAPQAEALL